MTRKIIYEVKLSKPLMTVAVMAAIGLLAIGLRPLVEITPAFANSNITKVAVCSESGQYCVDMFNCRDSYTTTCIGVRN